MSIQEKTHEEKSKEFLHACEENDITKMKTLLNQYTDIDINYTENYLNNSALSIIIENNNKEIIDYLISEKEKTNSFLFYYYKIKENQIHYNAMWAIGKNGNTELLKYILNLLELELPRPEGRGSSILIPYSIHTLIELSVAQVKGFGILLATVLALLAIITLLSYLVWLVSYIYAIKFARKNGLFEDINYLHKYKIKSIDWLIK